MVGYLAILKPLVKEIPKTPSIRQHLEMLLVSVIVDRVNET